MIADSGESDQRRALAKQLRRLHRSATVGKALMIFVVMFLLFSSLSILVGSVAFGGPQNRGSTLTSSVMATGSPPTFFVPPPSGIMTNKGDTVNFFIMVQDVDDDMINVTWDFGDGAPPVVIMTLPASSPQIVQTTHVYDPYFPGQGEFIANFTLNITLDDGNGNQAYRETPIQVNMPRNDPPEAPTVKYPLGQVEPGLVNIAFNTSDPEGDEIWWMFIFNNSVEDFLTLFNHTDRSAPNQNVWCNESVPLNFEGYTNITVYASDAPVPYQEFPHNVSNSGGPITTVYNLKPNATDTITASPQNPIINATIGYIEVMYSVQAFDLDGDILNVTWNFGDGTGDAYNESEGGSSPYTFEQVRNYTDAGVFNITANITDGRPGHEIDLNLTMTVMSTNRPPDHNLTYRYATGNFALPNETLNFTIVFTDEESDPLEVIVDWGDNSTWEYYNLTAYVDKNVTLLINHSYSEVGTYNITIWYTDHKIGLFDHNKNITNIVKVSLPIAVKHDIWSWWDYTSLGLLFLIPVGSVLRFYQVSRQRKALEREGFSIEEWKVMRSEMGRDALKKGGP